MCGVWGRKDVVVPDPKDCQPEVAKDSKAEVPGPVQLLVPIYF